MENNFRKTFPRSYYYWVMNDVNAHQQCLRASRCHTHVRSSWPGGVSIAPFSFIQHQRHSWEDKNCFENTSYLTCWQFFLYSTIRCVWPSLVFEKCHSSFLLFSIFLVVFLKLLTSNRKYYSNYFGILMLINDFNKKNNYIHFKAKINVAIILVFQYNVIIWIARTQRQYKLVS